MTSKAKYRIQYKKKRSAFSLKDITENSLAIAKKLDEIPAIWEYQNYHIFYPITALKEVDTLPIINKLWALQKNVSLPKINDNNLISVPYNKTDKLSLNSLGILEPTSTKKFIPSQLDVIFIPMLICDNFGNRIGYGKGFYDKFLQDITLDVLKIGLNFFLPIQPEIITEPTDVKIDYCVTPSAVVSFLDNVER